MKTSVLFLGLLFSLSVFATDFCNGPGCSPTSVQYKWRTKWCTLTGCTAHDIGGEGTFSYIKVPAQACEYKTLGLATMSDRYPVGCIRTDMKQSEQIAIIDTVHTCRRGAFSTPEGRLVDWKCGCKDDLAGWTDVGSGCFHKLRD